MTRVGLISDTHGLLRPEALEALRGSELILHAGDVGGPDVLAALAELAPVRAVRGNTDRGDWAQTLPLWDALEIEGVAVYLHHGHKPLDPAAGGFEVLVSGHSHEPSVRREGGVLFVNPGSAGPKRFTLPVTVARLELAGGHAEATLLPLAL